MDNKLTYLKYSLIVLGLMISFASGFFLQEFLGKKDDKWPILQQAYSIIESHGLKSPPPEKQLEYGMIRGLIQAYDDPYTIFVEPAEHELESDTLKGSFGGIGVRLEKDSQGNIILYPFPDSPAASSGIGEGDRLLAVDNLEITPDTTIEVIQAQLRGPVGSRVSLHISRKMDNQVQIYEVRRAEIPLPSVTWHLHPEDESVGIVEINVIAASTTDEIKKAIQDMKERGAIMFTLDLRDNFGGLLEAGVDVARLFLKEGVIIQHQYRGEKVKTFLVEQEGPYTDIPVAVLINQHTASAAEVIAGALQARDRGVLIGTPSFGKDTIQLVFDLADKSSLHVTAARWWIPGLEPALGDHGIQPDVLINLSGDPNFPDPYLHAVLEFYSNQ